MRIFSLVVLAHLLILLIFGLQKAEPLPPPGKIEIHTVQLQKPKKLQPPQPVVEKKAAPKKEVATKKKEEKQPTPAPKKSNSQLKKLLEESIASLDDSKPIEMETPPKMAALQSEQLTIVSYEMLLVEYLRELLELPEGGEVKLRLTLLRDGTVSTFEVLDGSSANCRYVEREIATLKLPAFETHFKGEKSHTFPITLKTY